MKTGIDFSQFEKGKYGLARPWHAGCETVYTCWYFVNKRGIYTMYGFKPRSNYEKCRYVGIERRPVWEKDQLSMTMIVTGINTLDGLPNIATGLPNLDKMQEETLRDSYDLYLGDDYWYSKDVLYKQFRGRAYKGREDKPWDLTL